MPGGLNVGGGGGEPERANAAGVSSRFFDVLAAVPLAGRTLQADDFREGTPRAAVIGERLWRRRFGGSRDAVGGRIVLNGNVFTVVGIMPAQVEFPSRSETWIPSWTDDQVGGAAFLPSVIARLAPGITHAQALAELNRVWTIQARESGNLRVPVRTSRL